MFFLERYELNKFITDTKIKLNDLRQALQIEAKIPELKKEDEKISMEDFWNDPEAAQTVIAKANSLRDTINIYKNLESDFNDINEYVEMAFQDPEIMIILEEMIEVFKDSLKQVEQRALLSGKYDFNNCIFILICIFLSTSTAMIFSRKILKVHILRIATAQ